VDANVSTYSGGYAYPAPGTTTIGGVDFTLASYAGGTGVVQLDGAESHDIAIDAGGIDTVYVIVKSAYGTFGANVGTLTVNGTGGNSYAVSLVEDVNIRDH